jgi:dihydrofolate reductase
MQVGLIVAVDPLYLIGIDGKIPWHYPADLRRFKELTMGGTLIMGSKTFLSLPGALPGRTTIVLFRGRTTATFCEHHPDVLVDSLGAALDKAKEIQRPVWIAGGAEVYHTALMMNVVDFIDLTLVPKVDLEAHAEAQKFTYFPSNLLEPFKRVLVERNVEDDRLCHHRYERPRDT